MTDILTPQQIKAARLLAEGCSGKDTADIVDVCQNTLSLWKRIPEFMSEIEKVMDEDRAAARSMFLRLAEKSVAALWSELHNDSSHSKRVQAALGILRLIGLDRIALPNTLEDMKMYAMPLTDASPAASPENAQLAAPDAPLP